MLNLSRFRTAILAAASIALCSPALAQQRPLATEDAEVIGGGRVLVEGGLDFVHEQQYPVSGLTGNLFRAPTIGLSIGVSNNVELQIDGGAFSSLGISRRDPGAPLANLVTATGSRTHDVEDLVVATKIRMVSEAPSRPALALRLATRLPNASNESGLGQDTTDFMGSVLAAKTVQSIRVVGNIGLGILGDPAEGHAQNDVLLYGVSLARAVTDRAEIVGDVNGRVSMRESAFPGTESRGLLTIGGRYTRGPIRFDGGIILGLTEVDPSVGATIGATYVFNAFTAP